MHGQSGEPPKQVSLTHRAVAAGGASVVSAFVVNPLDVVKTRIQAQGALGAGPAAETLLEKWNFAACQCDAVRLPGTPPGAPPSFCGPACSNMYTGTLDGLRKIVRAEGLGSLWRGTNVALMMAIPMVGIYLPLYDYLLAELQSTLATLDATSSSAAADGSSSGISGRAGAAAAAAPLLAGSLARTAAVYCTAPFEYVRTRMQAGAMLSGGAAASSACGAHAAAAGVAASSSSATAAAAAAAAAAASASSPGSSATAASSLGRRFLHHLPAPEAGRSRLSSVGRLWTGVGATLARDVPFSALYWGLVEPIRGALLPQPACNEWEVFAANVMAGGAAGALAGAVTTPLDVVKTRAQLLTGQAHPILGSLRSIASREGPRALFRGWSARSAKAAPACAIVLSAYEMLKHLHT